MSDEDRDVDIESDDDEDGQLNGGTAHLSQAEKRAHHNALERKRRDHIKESFHSLRDAVPALTGEKGSASRAQILKQATDYIQFMTKKNGSHQNDIDSLRRQNNILEQQVRALEKAKAAGSFAAKSAVENTKLGPPSTTGKTKKPLTSESASDSESLSDDKSPAKSKRKKLKT